MNLPTTPPTRFDTWVAGLDGLVVAGIVIIVLSVMLVVPGLIARLGKTETDEQARTRATTSRRKSGRVRA